MAMRINALKWAGLLTGVVALIHMGCIIFGAQWYRFLGAGEQMAQLAEAGHPYPAIVTGIIVCILSIWVAYAMSGAGLITKLPLLRLGLCVIAAILLLRAIGFYFIMPAFPENSLTFWWVSSSLCLMLGGLYVIGIIQSWNYLK